MGGDNRSDYNREDDAASEPHEEVEVPKAADEQDPKLFLDQLKAKEKNARSAREAAREAGRKGKPHGTSNKHRTSSSDYTSVNTTDSFSKPYQKAYKSAKPYKKSYESSKYHKGKSSAYKKTKREPLRPCRWCDGSYRDNDCKSPNKGKIITKKFEAYVARGNWTDG